MKLLNLLLAVLLFARNDDFIDTPASKEPTNIAVEMGSTASSMTDASGTCTFQANKECSAREDGKYKVSLVKSIYKNKGGKEEDILSYGIFDVVKKEYIYCTEEIDVAKRLERDWEFYDDINNPTNTSR